MLEGTYKSLVAMAPSLSVNGVLFKFTCFGLASVGFRYRFNLLEDDDPFADRLGAGARLFNALY